MALKSEIELLLQSVDDDFNPRLSVAISLPDYIDKILDKSTILPVYSKRELIAFASIYCNDMISLTGYMSMLVVSKNYRQNGIASNLLVSCINFLKEKGFVLLKLEVYKNNYRAINFYKKFGFKESLRINNSIIMEMILKEYIQE